MAKFTVVWSEAAEARLLEFWLAKRNPRSQLAADLIDRALAENPHDKGIRRSPNHSILRATPPEVLYSVSEQDRLVRILAVRIFLPT